MFDNYNSDYESLILARQEIIETDFEDDFEDEIIEEHDITKIYPFLMKVRQYK